MHVVPFMLVGGAIVITPGVDMALVTRNVLLHGRRTGLVTALGVNTGVLIWCLLATLGLAALLVASATAFRIVEIAGAAYLLLVGIRALRSTLGEGTLAAQPSPPSALSRAGAFRQGMLCNLLNPKVAVLFTSLLPQFAGSHASTLDLLVLGGIFNVMGISWLVTYSLLVARSRDVLLRPRVRRAFDRVSGLVLLGLGVRLALEVSGVGSPLSANRGRPG